MSGYEDPTKRKNRNIEKEFAYMKDYEECNTETICLHYIKGKCRQGLGGGISIGDQGGCKYNHPKGCLTYLNDVENMNGCRENECPNPHLVISKESLEIRTCLEQSGKVR